MDIEKKLEELIPENMLRRSETTLDALLSPIRKILHQRRFLDDPLNDHQIDLLLRLLASMDTDKDPQAARVGEREARVASPLVSALAAGFNHGIGRSGHITAPQPKAAGASLMQQLVNSIAVDALRKLGLPNINAGLVLPLSTGMALALIAATLRRLYGIKKVISPRIDHKSPSRAIELAGLELVIAPTVLNGDSVEADLDYLEKAASDETNLAIMATTTFFPPRAPDPVKEISKMCASHDIPFFINNAYGVQSFEVMKSIQGAVDAGRVDAIVQSGDKNFLTPVGSSIVASSSAEMVNQTASSYAGRASAAPLVQTLAALLSLGLKRYENLRMQQSECRALLERRLAEIADDIGQRVLNTVNPIACALTLDGLDVKSIGGRLYNRRVTGPRAVLAGGLGSCIDNYPHSYIVMNAAIGATKNDIEAATTKLYKELRS